MKYLIPLLIICLALALNANVQANSGYTADDVLFMHTHGGKVQAISTGYILAIYDIQKLNGNVCSSKTLTRGDIITMVIESLEQDHENLNYNAASTISIKLVAMLNCN